MHELRNKSISLKKKKTGCKASSMGDELQKTGAKSVGGELLFFFLILHPIVTRITVRDSPVWELRKVERRSDFLDVVLRLFCEPSNCFDAPGTDVLLHFA
ncbi:hypothetical protein TNIN_135551 [Trichonephila inaurata madagascariensis]|uniref:Uncharacterized protein n=1 Tax=Trichonephila inaurata madagascariensis TaxID=2747483 RepID=A0A8X6MGI2_9ARAC|nr:hypothetical protein TNIN_135551 [Trichonephila inaurata madagascariensis]